MLVVNPYMAPRMKIGKRWREVTTMVQEKGFCQNWGVDTLNKVSSMITWVEGGKSTWSPLGRVLEKDTVTFVGLCGKLDAVQHSKIQAKDKLKQQKEYTKEAQKMSCTAGEGMLEKSEEREEQREKVMETFHSSLLEWQDRALAI
ncbi:hypothetical protein JB92DRAFT_2833727 [Gautieria morchelliformis]|nr:hypothetical protein JB92DRAFT_2833727 [Gautieria morchelliformis]